MPPEDDRQPPPPDVADATAPTDDDSPPDLPDEHAGEPDEAPAFDPQTDALFERAVLDHGRRLLAIARSIVGYRASPEDVVQQAVMNLFKHRHRYDWRQPGGLLKRAVVNEALRLLRPPRMASVEGDVPDPSAGRDRSGRGGSGAYGLDPAEGTEDRETVVRVRAAIDKLPDHFRAALVLYEYDRMSYADIAVALNASVPQVKTWIFRARRKMADQLREYVEGRE